MHTIDYYVSMSMHTSIAQYAAGLASRACTDHELPGS